MWVAGLGLRIFPDSRGGENPLSQTAALPWWVRPEDSGLPSWRDVPAMKVIDDEVREVLEDLVNWHHNATYIRLRGAMAKKVRRS